MKQHKNISRRRSAFPFVTPRLIRGIISLLPWYYCIFYSAPALSLGRGQPERLYRKPFPSTQSVSLHPTTCVSDGGKMDYGYYVEKLNWMLFLRFTNVVRTRVYKVSSWIRRKHVVNIYWKKNCDTLNHWYHGGGTDDIPRSQHS